MLKAIGDYCIPQKNEVLEHFKLFSRKHLENDLFDVFYTDLKALVASREINENKFIVHPNNNWFA